MRFALRVAVAGFAVAAVLSMGITALVAGVPGRPVDPPGTVAASGTEAPSPSANAAAPPFPVTDGFVAAAGDMNGQVKEAASRFVQRVGTWGASGASDGRSRVVAAGYAPEMAATAAPLLDVPAREAVTTIVYPQYGGLTDSAASVMVLARQWLRTDEDERTREILLDIRLRPGPDGDWQVTSVIDPPRPEYAPARPGGPTDLGRAVLDNPRIRIPEPGRTDIADRRVGDPILSVLDQLGRTRDLDVQVLVSGHPGTVFPTTRLSNHTVGRAVDVRAIDGRLVVEIPRNDPVIAEFMAAAGRAGATEVGGPIVPPGTGFFTDDVHQDHFHLGITPTKPRAVAA